MPSIQEFYEFPSFRIDPKRLTDEQLDMSINLAFKTLDSIQAEWDNYWSIPGYKCISNLLKIQYKEVLESIESMARELNYRQISMR